ncbi:AIPR family protein [Streptomyces sp.]|uniref:AIPR family protein n=1 Tax=Streptomyces sp. TaxID=1931 RepID=UPI002D5D081F|nr:AIPR family protein [Streptomyces sp.]HZF89016.1 AIPR family protein [Streptomyces sp.]
MIHTSTVGSLPTLPHRPYLTWAPPVGTVHLTADAADLHPRRGNWHGWVRASALTHIAAKPDAATTLNATRGFLHDSDENRRLAEMLRHRPEDFGAAGEPIVLWARHIEVSRHPGSRITLHLHGPECVNGFQSLTTIAHCGRELEPARLDRAFARVDVVTGPEEDLARLRRLHYESRLYSNAVRPQDNLSRCAHLARIRAQYQDDGIDFDWRRGVVAGPHTGSYDIGMVFRALACFHGTAGPELIHRVGTDEGLDATWSDLDDRAYRALMNDGVQAVGVQRALETYSAALREIARLNNWSVAGHRHLIKYAPDLVIWTAARRLPLDELHRDGGGGFRWGTDEGNDAFRHMIRAAADELVAAYQVVSPKPSGPGRKNYKGEADRLDVWLKIVSRLPRLGKL